MSEACLMDGLLRSTDCAIAENAGSNAGNLATAPDIVEHHRLESFQRDSGMRSANSQIVDIFYSVFPRRPHERKPQFRVDIYTSRNNSPQTIIRILIINSDGCETRNLLRPVRRMDSPLNGG